MTKPKQGEGPQEMGPLTKQFDEVETAFGDLIHKMMREGMTPAEAGELDPSYLESLYAQAYRLYNTGKYIDSAQIFRSLVLLNSTEFKYLLGLSACYHMLKEYDNAIKTYTTCSLVDPKDPMPYYHSSDCYIGKDDLFSALICLDLTIKTAGDRSEFSQIKERAALTKERLKEELLARKTASTKS